MLTMARSPGGPLSSCAPGRHRPWNKDGKQLPPVHHASVGVEVKFQRLRCAVAVGRRTRLRYRRIPRFEMSSGRSPRGGWLSWSGRPAPGPSETPPLAAQRYADALELGDDRVRLPSLTPECSARPESGGWSRDPSCEAAASCWRRGRRTRAGAHRGVGGGRRAVRRWRTPDAGRIGVAFASWPNSKTGCAQT